MIESYGLHKDFLETTYYSKQEICNAEYYDMRFSCALEAAGTRASSYGTKYHSCCQECNIDGIPIGDILIDRKYVKKYSIASLKPDIIVSKQVKWLIESNNLTGVEFNHIVRDFKGRDIPEYYRLTINNYLDPVDNRTILSYSPPAKVCQECGRVVPYLRSNLYYKKAAFDSASDFNLTYELFDNWYEHNVVVSKKVKNIFTKYKVHAWFKMINIVEEIERQGTKGDFDISGTKGDVPFLSKEFI